MSDAQSFKIYTQAMDKYNSVLFKSMLQLIQLQLKQIWEYDESAKIVVVDVEQVEGKMFWDSTHANKILIAYGKQNLYDTTLFLQKPVRVQPLVALLNHLGSAEFVVTEKVVACGEVLSVAQKEKVASFKKSQALVLEDQRVFEPAYYLAGLLQQAVLSREVMRFSLPHSPPLYCLPQEKRCFTVKMGLRQESELLYCLPAHEIECAFVSREVCLEEVADLGLQPYCWETIQWLAVLAASQGRLMAKDFPPPQQVMLKQWPNFAILPHQPVHIQMAAFMLKHSTDLISIANATRVPLSVVIDFYNACKMLGLIVVDQAVVGKGRVTFLSDAKRFLFKNILGRLMS